MCLHDGQVSPGMWAKLDDEKPQKVMMLEQSVARTWARSKSFAGQY